MTQALPLLRQRILDQARWIRAEVARRWENKLRELMDAQFARGAGPTGAEWPEPKWGGAPMNRTGRLRRGFTYRAQVMPSGVKTYIDNKQEYFEYLQEGTERMDRRQMVPDNEGQVPRDWREAARYIYADVTREYWARNRVR